jgi:hypothetical protein
MMKKHVVVLLGLLLAGIALAKDGGEQRTRFESHPEGKIFKWPDHVAGDCHMVGATLIIRPNGTATFDADLWTHTHGTDIWHSRIRLFGQGREVFHTDNHDSPGIGHPQDGPQHKTHWHYDFTYDGKDFAVIDEASEHGDC